MSEKSDTQLEGLGNIDGLLEDEMLRDEFDISLDSDTKSNSNDN